MSFPTMTRGAGYGGSSMSFPTMTSGNGGYGNGYSAMPGSMSNTMPSSKYGGYGTGYGSYGGTQGYGTQGYGTQSYGTQGYVSPQSMSYAAPTSMSYASPMLVAPQTNMMAAPTGRAFSLQGNPASVTAPVKRMQMQAPAMQRQTAHSTRAPTTYFEQAYAPTTFASAVPTTVIEQAAYMRAGPTYVEPVSYSAPARVEERFSYVPSVSMSSYGAGKDLKAGGRVVSERPISREELAAHGNLSEGMTETRQGTYSNNGFAASRVAPVAFEQSALLGSSRSYTGTDPFRQSSSFRTQVDYGMTYAGGMRQMDYGAAPMASYGGGVTMIG